MDGLVQERRNSIANALELRLSSTNPSMICITKNKMHSLPDSLPTKAFMVLWSDPYTHGLCRCIKMNISLDIDIHSELNYCSKLDKMVIEK